VYQPDTKSNPNPNPTTRQHTIVKIRLNIVTCPTYPDKFTPRHVVAPSALLQVVIVTLPCARQTCANFMTPLSSGQTRWSCRYGKNLEDGGKNDRQTHSSSRPRCRLSLNTHAAATS